VAQKLIPNEALIYERSDGVVYAHYRDPPHNTIPRWIIGGDPAGVARAQGTLFGYDEWRDMQLIADQNPALKKQLDRLLIMYYTVKDSIEEPK
jgi:hypothetical protein